MPPIRHFAVALATTALGLALAGPAPAVTPNGRLQIIHLDVGQGDGAVLISPLGQVVMIDDGVGGNPVPASGVQVPVQLQALGVTHVDYHFASHYHSDHIGLFTTIFNTQTGVATLGYAWDRGGSYTTSYYTNYANLCSTLGNKRRTLVKNQVITLDSLSAHPVFIKVVDLNGAGISTTDENSCSLQLKVSYGEFDMSFGGDTPGANSGSYVNVETPEAPAMGPIEAYKVHHHGSATSSETTWLNATHPKVAVVSCGNGNSYRHPTASAVNRIHNVGTKMYWTERGSLASGAAVPQPGVDFVSNGEVIISATWAPGGIDTIRGNGFTDTFTNSGTALPDLTPPVVTLTSPNGEEDWKSGSAQVITWNATDDVGVTSVDLAYSLDGGSTFPYTIALGVPNTGSFQWLVAHAPTPAARVSVTAHDGANHAADDASDENFGISTWTIAAAAAAGGSISPSGSVAIGEDEAMEFTFTADAGYEVADAQVDGVSIGVVASYTFAYVTGDHSLDVVFQPAAAGVGDRPEILALGRPSPHPSHGEALLSFSLPAPGFARLEMLDLAGRRVWETSAFFSAGRHALRWSGHDAGAGQMPAGLYFLRLVTPWGDRTEHFVLIR